MSAPDAVIVGGGVIGLSIAWRAAQRGLEIVVVDDAPGRGASWAAAGMLAPVSEIHPGEERLLALNLESNRRYPAYVAELEEATGREAGFRPSGTLLVARDADENAALDELFWLQREFGLEAERLRGSECRELEPGLTPRARGGILVANDHQVDSRALVEALLEACRRAPVELCRARAAEVTSDARGVTGITLGDGDAILAPNVVLCAGCWSGTIAGIPPEAVPVRPVKGQLVHLRAPQDPPLASRSIRGGGVYVVPRADGRIAVGATVEEQGFDTRVTAGAVLTLLREAYEILPGLAEAELTETAVGLRPGSPDNAPLLGRTTHLDGLHVATGHHRNGILLAPVTADAIADLLATGEVPELVAPFSPGRFAPGVRIAE